MKKPEGDLEKTTHREFLKFLGLGALAGAAALTGINCVPAGQAHSSNWPRRHVYESVEIDPVDVHLEEHPSRIFGLLRFERGYVERADNLGNRRVLRLRRGCGAPHHASNCITASQYGLHTLGIGSPGLELDSHAPDASVLVTFNPANRTLEYVLQGDDVSFCEIRYERGTGFSREDGPRLSIRTYNVGGGRVIQPVPAGSGAQFERQIAGSDMRREDWELLVDIHNLLSAQDYFNGNSILSGAEAVEAKYFAGSNVAVLLRHMNYSSETSPSPPLLGRSQELLDYARAYRLVSARVNRGINSRTYTESPADSERRAEFNITLRDVYEAMSNELSQSAWETDRTVRLRREDQARQIRQNLNLARREIGY
jgi:hypothetical protein